MLVTIIYIFNSEHPSNTSTLFVFVDVKLKLLVFYDAITFTSQSNIKRIKFLLCDRASCAVYASASNWFSSPGKNRFEMPIFKERAYRRAMASKFVSACYELS